MGRTPHAEAVPVHVVNGDSVAGTLALSGLPGEVVVWRDVLHEGAFPPADPVAAARARGAFLAAAGCGAVEAITADLVSASAALTAALDAGRETVLWFEHDLYDQLQLVQILERIHAHPLRGCVRLLTIDRHPAHPRFAGLGELSAPELAALWPLRRELDPGAFPLAVRVCAALRAERRAGLAALSRKSHPALPFLAAALARLLEERPWAASPLGRSERQILRAVAEGATTRPEVFAAAQAMEAAPFMGDTWVWRRLDELASGGRPLLATDAGGLALTAAGREALAS